MKRFLGCVVMALSLGAAGGETLYNGIVLPDVWPPSRSLEAMRAGEVMKAPYLESPPAVIRVDGTKLEVGWKGAEDLAALAGQAVRVQFMLARGSLYSFWISPDASGASHGYVAAGGPGFTGGTDTTGK